jgi:hypothetical protein
MMLSHADSDWDWNVNLKDMNAKDSSHPAKFRDLIREIKQRADLGPG